MRRAEDFVETLTLSSGGDGAGAAFNLTNGLKVPLPTWGLWLKIRGRFVIGTAAATLVPVLSPLSFIERVLVRGSLSGRGGFETLVDIPGTLLYAFAAMVTGQYPKFDEDNLVGGAGATGTYDIDVDIPVPFCTIGKLNAADEMVLRTLVMPGEFSGSLEVEIRTGGNDSIIDRAATSTVTATAYGSGSGSPSCEVHAVRYRLDRGEYESAGAKFLSQKQLARTFTLGSNLTNQLIGQLGTAQRYARVLTRTGDLDSDSDPALGGVSNTATDRLYLRLGANEQIRDVQFLSKHSMDAWFQGRNEGWRELIATAAGSYTGGQATREFVGCQMWDFVERGILEDALDTRRLGASGQQLEIWGDVTTETGLQMEAVTEVLRPK